MPAEPIENQLIQWLQAFQPDERLRQRILDTIKAKAHGAHSDDEAVKRRGLLSKLERLRDLYVLGDLTKSQYIMRRQAIEEELQRLKPPTDPQLDRAQAILEDFAKFWETEHCFWGEHARRVVESRVARRASSSGALAANATLLWPPARARSASSAESRCGAERGFDPRRSRDLGLSSRLTLARREPAVEVPAWISRPVPCSSSRSTS